MTFDPTKSPNFISGDRKTQQEPGKTRDQMQKEGWIVVDKPRDDKPQQDSKD